MFAKLLKHELKASSGLLSILSAAALGVGLLGGFLLRFAVNRGMEGNDVEVLVILAFVALPFVFISLLAYSLGGQIYLAVQFYKSKFTDRGYLTFTLPVRAWQIYLSSLINIVLWTVIIGLVVAGAFVITVVIGLIDTPVWREMKVVFNMVPLEEVVGIYGFSGWSLVQSVLGYFSSAVTLITGITLGCVVAKKHKVLASVGFYFAITAVIGIVNAVVSITSMFATLAGELDLAYITTTCIEAAVVIGGSIVSVLLMDRKLNLP